jgi:hypothetical protein
VEESGEKLDRTLARAEVENEVRAEYAEAALNLQNTERPKRMFALAVTLVLLGILLLPLIALVLGVSWRILMWAATGG